MRFLVTEKLSSHKYKTPEGYLICTDAILSRTGKQEYKRSEIFGDACDEPDKIVNVDRTDAEVFDDKAMASFENKPICIEHPDEDVNVENHNDLSVGFVRDIHKGEDNGKPVMMGTLVITDENAIRLIENGEYTELSCGYDCDIVDDKHPTQRNIRGNHVALCQHGRAGNARIVDSANDDLYGLIKEPVKRYYLAKKYDKKWDIEENIVIIAKNISEAEQKLKRRFPDAYNLREISHSEYLKFRRGNVIIDSANDDTLVSADKPNIKALGKWEWDEVMNDWYDTGRHMYYNEVVRKSGGKDSNGPIRVLETGNSYRFSVVDAANKMDKNKLNKLKAYFDMISSYTSRDVDITDIIRTLQHKGYNVVRTNIRGWMKRNGTLYKEYDLIIDNSVHATVTLYADEDTYQVNEVNAYITDSVKVNTADDVKVTDDDVEWLRALDRYNIKFDFINGGYSMRFKSNADYALAKKLAIQYRMKHGYWDDKALTYSDYRSTTISQDDSIKDIQSTKAPGIDKIIYVMQSDVDKDLYFYIGKIFSMKEGNWGYTKFEMGNTTPDELKSELARNGWHQVASGPARVIDTSDVMLSGRYVYFDFTEVKGKNLKQEIERKYNSKFNEKIKVKRLNKHWVPGKKEVEIQVFADGMHENYDGFWAVVQATEEESKQLKDDWTDVYKQFEAIVTKYFPNSTKINAEVDKMYAQHKGNADWDLAYKRWKETKTEDSAHASDSKKMFEVSFVKDDVIYIHKVRANSIEDAISKVNDNKFIGEGIVTQVYGDRFGHKFDVSVAGKAYKFVTQNNIASTGAASKNDKVKVYQTDGGSIVFVLK